jgi:ethanolamine utilization protein EutA
MFDALRPLRHDDEEDHWHYEDDPDAIVEDIEGMESFKQQSVGIDIGSSTSHLIFSELTLRRDRLTGKYSVAGRKTLHRSAILLTPYMSPTQIDADRLKGFFDRTYAAAGMTPADVDAGAVVITGEALKKENARPILEMFSREAGKFICASAGPNHEALLAAHGSGGVAYSKANHARVLVVDMGGGTTKLALIDDGQVLHTAAINIGARLIAFGEDDTLTRIEEPARIILGDRDNRIELGSKVTPEMKERLVNAMTDCLFEVLEGRPLSDLADELMITNGMPDYTGLGDIDRVMCSGGVSEYVYGRDHTSYGDLGPMLGRAIRQRFARLDRQDLLAPSDAGIRATVIGAGEYTVQASGTTSHLANRELLPVYGMQVVKPNSMKPDELVESIEEALGRMDLMQYGNGLMLAIELEEVPNYVYLRRIADAVYEIAQRASADTKAMFLAVDKDVAKSLGAILRDELGLKQELICIDGIEVGDLDYIDIGGAIGKSEVLPVTVKSLVFPTKIKI